MIEWSTQHSNDARSRNDHFYRKKYPLNKRHEVSEESDQPHQH